VPRKFDKWQQPCTRPVVSNFFAKASIVFLTSYVLLLLMAYSAEKVKSSKITTLTHLTYLSDYSVQCSRFSRPMMSLLCDDNKNDE
jgi:hypothetical protein